MNAKSAHRHFLSSRGLDELGRRSLRARWLVLAGVCVLAPEQGLRIDSGTRHMVIKPADLVPASAVPAGMGGPACTATRSGLLPGLACPSGGSCPARATAAIQGPVPSRRRGPAPLQPYRDLLKLIRKEVVVAESASWLFRAAPYAIEVIGPALEDEACGPHEGFWKK